MDRTKENIREHYDVEKELAHKLRHATKEERGKLYSSLYDELYRRVPHHPQLRKKNKTELDNAIRGRLKFIKHHINTNTTFLEIGPGDCQLSVQISKFVQYVYTVDVSDEITKEVEFPDNCKLILSDGISIPVPKDSVDVAFSYQLIEHLHPDDALEQLRNIYNTLKPNGIYICLTPNKLYGPHDISKHFDEEATGFHLKEYTNRELCRLFENCGFARTRVLVGARGYYLSIPPSVIFILEHLLAKMPFYMRKIVAGNILFRILLGCRIIGSKTG